MSDYDYIYKGFKKNYKKYVNKIKEKNFVLDCTTAIKADYDPFDDRFLSRFFNNYTARRDMRKTGIISRRGKPRRRNLTGFNSGTWERTLKIPAYIYNKGDNPGKINVPEKKFKPRARKIRSYNNWQSKEFKKELKYLSFANKNFP